jgi:hypothetical protein
MAVGRKRWESESGGAIWEKGAMPRRATRELSGHGEMERREETDAVI